MKSLVTLTLAFSVFVISGCSSIRKVTMPDEDNLLSGAGSMLVGNFSGKPEEFERINISGLLLEYGFESPTTIANSLEGESGKKSGEKYQYLRNEMQDHIIAASNQRCGAFQRMMIASKAQTKMGWSSIATLLSGAATVVTHVDTAKALSAGSTVSNSILNSYNEAYFNDLALNVISSGISKRRENLLKLMEVERGKNIYAYPANRAIADALNYHAACNIVSGLEAAAEAIRDNPLSPEVKVIVSAKVLQDAMAVAEDAVLVAANAEFVAASAKTAASIAMADAKITADEAKTKADEAKTTADYAKTKADDAKEKADHAKAMADDFREKAGNAQEISYAKTLVEETNAKANAARVVADEANAKANAAKVVADEAKIKADAVKAKVGA